MSLVLASLAAVAMQPADTNERDTEVMVLGMYHLSNPGLDMINVDAGDVMQPEPQRELQAIADALATWRPTKILVESQSGSADLTMVSYREEADRLIAENPSETYQVGYRLARMLGHDEVYGFDEQPGEGEPDYFPMGAVQAWAQENGKAAELGALFEWAREYISGKDAEVAHCSIAGKLVFHNDPATSAEGHRKLYYGVIPFGDADTQAGAELNAFWYMRNAKMFAKADMVAEPGDRVLIIVGSGHKYWLDHFVTEMEGYRLVDARPYLRQAAGDPC